MAQHRTLRAGRDPRSGNGSGWYVLAPRHRVRGKFACVRLVLLWIYAVENQLQAMCVPGRRRPALRGGLVACVAYGGSDLAYLRTTAQSRFGVRMCEVASRTTMKSSTFLLSKSHSRSAIRPPAAEMRVGSRKKAGTRTLSTLRRVATCCTSVVTCFDVAAWLRQERGIGRRQESGCSRSRHTNNRIASPLLVAMTCKLKHGFDTSSRCTNSTIGASGLTIPRRRPSLLSVRTTARYH